MIAEHTRAQIHIRGGKDREKHTTAAFRNSRFHAQSILAWTEANCDQWRLEHAKVDAGEKKPPSLDVRGARPSTSPRTPER